MANTTHPLLSMPSCDHEDCLRPAHCKGLCQAHYRRARGLIPADKPIRGQRLNDVSQRFLANIERTDSCWLWTGGLYGNGYGMASIIGRNVLAHRLAYELFVGPIPAGLVVDHVHDRGCRHRNCVNPDHLEPVTVAENNRRANAVPGARPARTLCMRGLHPLTEENVTVSNGRRSCRACKAAYAKQRRTERRRLT